MGKLQEFTVKLDDGKINYMAGEIVSGNVVVNLAQVMEVTRITIQLIGKARCTAGSRCSEQVHEVNATLFGSPSGTHSHTQHPSGKHDYQFGFQLPESLPSSVAESNGYIKYKLIGKITYKGLIGLISKNWEVKEGITIQEKIDANLPEDSMQPIQQLRKTAHLFTNKQKLEKHDLLISTGRGVYCPQEDININIQYKDGVARKMGGVRVRLNKYCLFNAKENKTYHSTKKVIVDTQEAKKKEKIVHQTVTIKVPEKTAATNILTNAVVLNYIIHVKVEGYPEMKLPIIIGTIPYDENKAMQAIVGNEEAEPAIKTNPVAVVEASAPPIAPPYSETDDQLSTATNGHLPHHAPFSYIARQNQFSNLYPDLYIPENEFDLPPSYEESVAPTAPVIPVN